MNLYERMKVYAPQGAEIGSLPFPTEWQRNNPFNDVPAATLNYRVGTTGFEYLNQLCEVAFEMSPTGTEDDWIEPPNSRFLRVKRSLSKIGLDDVNKYTLPGYAWLLGKARQDKTTGLNSDGKRMFNAVNPGMIMLTLINENKARGGSCAGMSTSFTTTTDSNGVAWGTGSINIGYEPGLDYFTILNNLSLQGAVDWNFTGRTLNLYRTDGPLSTVKSLTLLPGRDVEAMPIEASLEELVHNVLILGDGGKRLTMAQSANIISPWGKWEGFVSQGGVSDTGTMTLFGNSALQEGDHEKVQFTAEMNREKSIYTPMIDFLPGHYVNAPNENLEQTQYRVRGINFSRKAGGEKTIDLILNDRFIERELRNARRTNGITGGASNGGSGTPASKPVPETASRTPKAPTGLVLGSTAYMEITGANRAILTAQWSAVTVDVNDIAMENVRYQVQFRGTSSTNPQPPFYYMGETSNLTLSLQGLPQATEFYVQVRALAETGKPSAWSPGVLHTTQSDTEAPPATSKPSAATAYGTVTLNWNGRDAAGLLMPRDFQRADIYQVGKADPIGAFYSRSSFVISDVVVGQEYSFFLRPYDGTQNVGPDSAIETIIVKGVMDDPSVQEQINDAVLNSAASGNAITHSSSIPPTAEGTNDNRKIGDTWFQNVGGVIIGQWTWMAEQWIPNTVGTQVIANLDAAKITTGILNADRIAVNSLHGDKIIVGTITANKLTATAIDGKTITGASIRTDASATASRISMHVSTITPGNSYLTIGNRLESRTTGTNQGWLFRASDGYTNVLDDTGATFLVVDPTRGKVTVVGSFQTGAGGARTIIKENGTFESFNEDGARLMLMRTAADYSGSVTRFFGPLQAEMLNFYPATSTELRGQIVQDTARFTLNAARSGQRLELDASAYVSSSKIRSTTLNGDGNQYSNDYLTCTVNGEIRRIIFTSAERYKIAIQESKMSYRGILDVKLKTWHWKEDAEKYAEFLSAHSPYDVLTVDESTQLDDLRIKKDQGFIAEEVLKAGLPEYVTYNEEGEVEGLNYNRMWMPLVPLAQEHDTRITELEQSLAEMKAELQALRG